MKKKSIINEKNVVMNIMRIDKISIYDDCKFCVFPSEDAINDSFFSMVYRAAQSVYWNEIDKCFYITVKKVNAEWCFNQIVSAIAIELGYALLIDEETKWKNVCPIDKSVIIAKYAK